MRKGTLVTIILLFVVILVVAIVQLNLASGERPECPGPVETPNALPLEHQPVDCR